MSENKEKAPAQGKDAKKKSIKRILYPLLFLVVLCACFGGYYVYSQNQNYFTTDNAKVTAKLYNVMPVTNGKLISWDVENGDLVEKDQVLGRQETLPYITSPISGTVVRNDGAVGQVAAASSPVAIVADTANLYIGVNIEETDIMKIRVGQSVDVHIDAYPKRTFKGQVTEIDPATQTYFSGASSFTTSGTYTKVTQLIPVKVSIENEENLPLMYGMNATVKIHLQ